MLFEFKMTKESNLDEFLTMMREKYPTIFNRKRLCVHPEERTKELVEDCRKLKIAIVPISTFVETTFTAEEMAALHEVVQFAASRCGGGEDTIGAIMYTGAFHRLKNTEGAVAALARKIDCYGD